MITVFSKPKAMFEATPEVVTFINPEVEFYNLSTDNYYNYWYFGDGEMSSSANPYHNYSQVGEYNVLLVVESEYGCVDSVKQHISVKDEFTLYVPTAFSPDNDGINDSFKAVGNGIDVNNFSLRVYDRWGEVIWETDNFYEEWNGSAKNNNKIVQNGTYKWLIICKDFNGVEYAKSGNVTVIR
jgi:gliding motility-associated-like protein